MKKTRILVILSLLLALLMSCGALAEFYEPNDTIPNDEAREILTELVDVLRGQYNSSSDQSDEDEISREQAGAIVKKIALSPEGQQPITVEKYASALNYSWAKLPADEQGAGAEGKPFTPTVTADRTEYLAEYSGERLTRELGVEMLLREAELMTGSRLLDKGEMLKIVLSSDPGYDGPNPSPGDAWFFDGRQPEDDLTRGDAMYMVYKSTSAVIPADEGIPVKWMDGLATEIFDELPAGDIECPACGESYSYPDGRYDHVLAACGVHGICEGGRHELAPCGEHYFCDKTADHYYGNCGRHFSCDGGNHDFAPCGVHNVCDENYAEAEHAAAGCGASGHFLCDGGDHATAAACGMNGHFSCAGDHQQLPCGEWSCAVANPDSKDHSGQAGCGHYYCTPNIVSASHASVNCDGETHYVCDGRLHLRDACGHYSCVSTYDAAEHAVCACGAYICADDSHTTLAPCGIHTLCQKNMDHYMASCGVHHACEAPSHGFAPCGSHRLCEDGFDLAEHANASCGTSGHYACDGADHSAAAACGIPGHFSCGQHQQLPCGEWSCAVANPDSKDHSWQAGCGHYHCTPNIVSASHASINCGGQEHYVCDGRWHGQCACGKWHCHDGFDSGEHLSCPGGCGQKMCVINEFGAGHQHRRCSGCGVYVCGPDYDESQHHKCIGCLELLCGSSADHSHCPGCNRYVCSERDNYFGHDHTRVGDRWMCLDYEEEEEEPEALPDEPDGHNCPYPEYSEICSRCGLCIVCNEDQWYCYLGCGQHDCSRDNDVHNQCGHCHYCEKDGHHGDGICNI